jgi:hypothetical protein
LKKIYILASLLLLAILIYTGIGKGWFNGSNPDLKDFAVKDTLAIDKIFMADRTGRSILLEKKAGKWWLNGTYEANKGWLNQLLNTIIHVQVKAPVPAGFRNGLIKTLATNHVKVEIYTNGTLAKTYFVGSSTQDMKGTYMLLEGAKDPYICEVPGFDGFLTDRYHLDETTWRSRKVVSFTPDSLEKVEVKYFTNPEWNFNLKGPWASPTLSSGAQAMTNADTSMLRYYLGVFNELYAEAFGKTIPYLNCDSVSRTAPWCEISLTSAGKLTILTIHKKSVDEQSRVQFMDDGTPADFDTERYYAFINHGKDLYVIQDYVFGKVFRKYNDFVKK